AAALACTAPAAPVDTRGAQFLGFKSFSSFEKVLGDNANETLLISPEFATLFKWDQLIVSWNADSTADNYLKVEARGLSPGHATRYYTMGIWSAEPAWNPRESVSNQKDLDGDVSTDTLTVKTP